MEQGIAGWPLRKACLQEIAATVAITSVDLIEIPKDVLDTVSLKGLFNVLQSSGKVVSLAGTTDLANLAGMSWSHYQRYLDIQLAQVRFLRCRYWRIFLQAVTEDELVLSLQRLDAYAQRCCDVELLIETHGGFESTQEGFAYCLSQSDYRFVVDFANIDDPALSKRIAGGEFRDRIAYFHTRNLKKYVEAVGISALEEQAWLSHPNHAFLWEPKALEGAEALTEFKAAAPTRRNRRPDESSSTF